MVRAWWRWARGAARGAIGASASSGPGGSSGGRARAPRGRVASLGAVVSVVAVAGAGCVHRVATKWDPATRTICGGARCFRVGPLAPDWRVVHEQQGGVGFFSEPRGGVIEAKATCRDDAEATPLSALANQLLIGYTARAVRLSETLPMDGREALHTVVDAKLDGVPVVLDLYVLKRDGCIFDLSYAAPAAAADSGAADFRRFVAGFADGRRPL